MTRCEVCTRRMNHRAKGTVCYRCRMAGAAFARGWMALLKSQGVALPVIAEITGTTIDTVRARLWERSHV